jgi:hypothetical protein
MGMQSWTWQLTGSIRCVSYEACNKLGTPSTAWASLNNPARLHERSMNCKHLFYKECHVTLYSNVDLMQRLVWHYLVEHCVVRSILYSQLCNDWHVAVCNLTSCIRACSKPVSCNIIHSITLYDDTRVCDALTYRLPQQLLCLLLLSGAWQLHAPARQLLAGRHTAC